MARITSSPVAYDCGTCGKPVYLGVDGWKHCDRHVVCEIVSVLEVALALAVLTKTA
jgi:hypothetical protein